MPITSDNKKKVALISNNKSDFAAQATSINMRNPTQARFHDLLISRMILRDHALVTVYRAEFAPGRLLLLPRRRLLT